MSYQRLGWVAFLSIFAVAILLRAPRLEKRPMHTDEAVQAYKFGELLESGRYVYDPVEHHGPTLNYFTLVSAWLTSHDSYEELTESSLRAVPVFFSLLALILLLLLREGLGTPAILSAALLSAVSPAMVFYSRYYIMEMLLVCFTIGIIASGYRYYRTKKTGWAITTGIFLGMAHATKETSIIIFFCLIVALGATYMMMQKEGRTERRPTELLKSRPLLYAAAAAIFTSALLYSSFFRNPAGILDSFTAYTGYFQQAAGDSAHVHPWYYYLKMLVYSRFGDGPVWSELIIILLAVAGMYAGISGRNSRGTDVNLLRFMALFTLSLFLILSIIPYKTPWNMLVPLAGLIILGGAGVSALIDWFPKYIHRIVLSALLTIGVLHLTFQSYRAVFSYASDSRNPYVYAHTDEDIFEIIRLVDEAAASHPDGKNLRIQVICSGHDYWPLPWYMRGYHNVGWHESLPVETEPAPVYIISPDMESDLAKHLYSDIPPGSRQLYVPLFDRYTELRPGVELRGYVSKNLYDRMNVDPVIP